jgi:hypothetical protein
MIAATRLHLKAQATEYLTEIVGLNLFRECRGVRDREISKGRVALYLVFVR